MQEEVNCVTWAVENERDYVLHKKDKKERSMVEKVVRRTYRVRLICLNENSEINERTQAFAGVCMRACVRIVLSGVYTLYEHAGEQSQRAN